MNPHHAPAAADRPIPYTLTPKAHAALDGHWPAAIPPGQWACQRCGAAFFGTPPGHGHCPGCAPACVGVWSGAVAPGGYVCAWPDPAMPDGICGWPVESEPCPEHAPGGDR